MIENIPKWVCPTCGNGALTLSEDKFMHAETSASCKQRNHKEWDFEWIRYRFAGLLTCSNNVCKEHVSFSGEGKVEGMAYYEEAYEQYVEDHSNVFTPHVFDPPLNLFIVPHRCPVEVRKEIISAFGLFWNDISACANRVRLVVEMLMTEHGVKRFVNKNGKRTALTLHNRLELYKKVQPEVADHLLAIKWIGNSGSHTGKIEKGDIIDAFELLEYSLNKLFDDTEKRVSNLAKKINRAKGPLPKKRLF
jgi:hypothetical protein